MSHEATRRKTMGEAGRRQNEFRNLEVKLEQKTEEDGSG